MGNGRPDGRLLGARGVSQWARGQGALLRCWIPDGPEDEAVLPF